VDYPHSTRAKKFFLVLMVGPSMVSMPQVSVSAEQGWGLWFVKAVFVLCSSKLLLFQRSDYQITRCAAHV
jgi:hypothetical protein